jgi:hypothetical protein
MNKKVLNKSWLRERWGKVPASASIKIANECSKGVDWNGSTKGRILNAYICSALWNDGKIAKDKCGIMYKFDPSNMPFNPAKFEWFMDRVQLHIIEMERAVYGDFAFAMSRWDNHWTNKQEKK